MHARNEDMFNVTIYKDVWMRCNALQHAVTRCNALQHTATYTCFDYC